MIPRWVTERKIINQDNEILTIIEIYAIGETEQTVKEENKHRKYKRELIRHST